MTNDFTATRTHPPKHQSRPTYHQPSPRVLACSRLSALPLRNFSPQPPPSFRLHVRCMPLPRPRPMSVPSPLYSLARPPHSVVLGHSLSTLLPPYLDRNDHQRDARAMAGQDPPGWQELASFVEEFHAKHGITWGYLANELIGIHGYEMSLWRNRKVCRLRPLKCRLQRSTPKISNSRDHTPTKLLV